MARTSRVSTIIACGHTLRRRIFPLTSLHELGVLLILLDVIIGLDVILPIGVAALILAGFIFAQQSMWIEEPIAISTWRGVLILFAALSIVSIGIIRLVFQRSRKSKPDINEY